MNKSPKPLNIKLYNKIKAEARKKFKVYPSIYTSSYIVREYKKQGGKYSGKKPSKSSGLSRWRSERWVDICSSPPKKCGRSKTSTSNWKKNYPYCRPSVRVNKNTPKTLGELSKAEIKRRCSAKRKQPMKILRPKKTKV